MPDSYLVVFTPISSRRRESIFMLGDDDQGWTQQAVQEIGPSVGFLLKPFPTTALLGQVRRLLDR